MSQSLLIKYDAFIAKEVHRFVKRYGIKYEDFDDYLQQARLGVLKYEKSHDIDADNMTAIDYAKLKSEIFSVLFAYMWNNTTFSGINAHNYKAVPKGMKNVLPLSEGQFVIDRSTQRYFDRSEVESYKFTHSRIVSLFLDGYNFNDIAKKLNISSRAVKYMIFKNAKDYIKHSA